MAVLPYGKSGVIGGAMLGLGRALGETLAVAIVLSASGGITFNLISQQQPVDDRGEHRAAVPRVDRPGREHPDRQRPGAVRHHPRRQHARPLDRQPARRLLRSELMTATRSADPGTAAPPPGGSVEQHRRLPRFAAAGLFVVGAARRRRPARRSPASTSSLAVVYGGRPRHASPCTSRSRAVEGARKAHRPAGDLRGHDGLRASPWCRWSRWSATVLSRGLAAAGRRVLQLLDARHRRRGRRRVPRHLRHADHHRRSPRSSRCRSAC